MTAEQEARDMLERIGVDDAQSFASGDLVELANLIERVRVLREAATSSLETWIAYSQRGNTAFHATKFAQAMQALSDALEATK